MNVNYAEACAPNVMRLDNASLHRLAEFWEEGHPRRLCDLGKFTGECCRRPLKVHRKTPAIVPAEDATKRGTA
jgi:hypothetical protein